MTPTEMTPIETARQRLVDYFFSIPSDAPPVPPSAADALKPWVNAIAIGMLPDDPPETEKILIFADPGAECQLGGIQAKANDVIKDIKPLPPIRVLRAARFVGLAAAPSSFPVPMMPGTSLSPVNRFRYNIPQAFAGTFGALVTANNKSYMLCSNHVLACNGRVPVGTPVLYPGPLDDATGGLEVGTRSPFFQELVPPPWPWTGANRNTVDCALAEVSQGAPVQVHAPPPATPLTIVPTASLGTILQKTGRSTRTTMSRLRIRRWAGYIDFTFGTYFFDEMMGTYQPAGSTINIVDANPPSPPPATPERIFAAPGDSGAVALAGGQGLGLVTARGYCFDAPPPGFLNGPLQAFVILMCSLDLVAQALAKSMNLQKGDLTFRI